MQQSTMALRFSELEPLGELGCPETHLQPPIFYPSQLFKAMLSMELLIS
jgi:hypothetical protein